MAYSLRYYQSESCDAAWASLCSAPGNPVIVLPTGAGKSVVIAELCRVAVERWAGRVMVLAHRGELLSQNYEKIRSLLPWSVSTGIYSAGLRRHATDDQVIVAGIQSVFRKAELFGARHLVIIDEAHLVPIEGEGMYRTFIDDLRRYNPKLRMIGLTATPFRTDSGPLCRADALFQSVCYEAKIQALIADGFLSQITNQPPDNGYDTSKLHVRGGEFVARELEDLFADSDKTVAAAKEIVAKTRDRRSILVFCTGIAHAEHTAAIIESLTSEPVGLVTSEVTALERSAAIDGFRSGKLRWLVNVDVLTTGFDAPGIDAIAVLRATMSPGLFAQICGRGLRIAEGKSDCLILDFGENIKRHGPIDAIDYGRPKGRAEQNGDAEGPVKSCPNCEAVLPAGRLQCDCGFLFPKRELKHDTTADTSSDVLARPQEWVVESVDMRRHQKRNAPPGTPDTLRVDYVCQPADRERGNVSEQTVSEWVCLHHPAGSFALRKAADWWRARSKADIPGGIDEAIDLWQRGAVAMPSRITTIREGRFFRILSQVLDEIPENWADEVAEVGWESPDW